MPMSSAMKNMMLGFSAARNLQANRSGVATALSFRQSRRVTRFLLSLCLGVLSLSAAEKPNIIFFMADDMGMGDTSAYQDFTGNAAEVNRLVRSMETAVENIPS